MFSASPSQAQEVTSRPVVQPLPSQEAQRLNRALLQLAKRPRDMSALLEAGDSAVAVGDLDAALGFFGRARELEPDNAKVAFGLASVYLRSGRPVSALSLLRSARATRTQDFTILLEEALALDMVGEQAAAQDAYARVIKSQPDNTEAQRRLALSYAISGNSEGFESTLRPLVERRDFAAFRTRAFGLAIMGEQARAAAIVDAVMPRDLAGRVSPYLEFMPRLTPSQQAAAANLGIFPRAADIGRNSPEIAAYRSGQSGITAASTTPRIAAAPVMDAGQMLEPVGEPLGGARTIEKPADSPVRVAAAEPLLAAPKPAPTPTPTPTPVIAPQTVSIPASSAISYDLSAETNAAAMATSAPAEVSAPVVLAQSDPAPATVSQPANQPPPQPEPKPARVADAFDDLLSDPAPRATATGTRASGAVDLARIEIPREAPPAAKPASTSAAAVKAEPAKPAQPRRIWVQLATGRDLKALAFDWRRLERKAPDLLGDMKAHTTPWGQANRLLVGPIASDAQARKLVGALKEKGLELVFLHQP